MPEHPVPTPVRSQAHSVWAIAPMDEGDVDYGTTGIWHADIDCPGIRDWQAAAGIRASTIMEIDRLASTFTEWVLDEDGWEQIDILGHRMDLSDWRSCRRCGTTSSEPPEVCPQCFLTICDCADD